MMCHRTGGPAEAARAVAMDTMMADMMVPLTSEPDVDFCRRDDPAA